MSTRKKRAPRSRALWSVVADSLARDDESKTYVRELISQT